ncbi:hypothetical protein SDJN03_21751, partial [Cucurbita argyrosperma subsp. sororia]
MEPRREVEGFFLLQVDRKHNRTEASCSLTPGLRRGFGALSAQITLLRSGLMRRLGLGSWAVGAGGGLGSRFAGAAGVGCYKRGPNHLKHTQISA